MAFLRIVVNIYATLSGTRPCGAGRRYGLLYSSSTRVRLPAPALATSILSHAAVVTGKVLRRAAEGSEAKRQARRRKRMCPRMSGVVRLSRANVVR